MTYPGIFYFQEKSNDPEYGTSQPGEISVTRLANQRPYRKKDCKKEARKKSLILSDWTIGKWSQEKLTKATAAIQKLINDGFEIYIWQDPEVILLNETNLARFAENASLPIIDSADEVIADAAIAAYPNLLKDQIHILDDYWLEQVIDPNPDRQRSLYLEHLERLTRHNIKALFSVLDTKQPPLEAIIVSKFSIDSSNLLEILKNQLLNLEIRYPYRSLALDSKDATTLLDNGELHFNSIKITSAQLSNIEELSIDDKTDAKQLEDLLSKLPRLKLLEIPKDFEGDINDLLMLTSLEKLNLFYCELSKPTLISLLSNASALKSLNFNDLELSDDINHRFSLTSLEELTLSSDISETNLDNFFRNSRKLRILNLEHNTQLGKITKTLSLSLLETLNSKFSKILGSELLSLLEKTPVLTSLDLVGATISGESNKAVSLFSVQEINLNLAKISALTLQSLLANATSLKTLYMEHCAISGDITEALPLRSLESLSIQYVKKSVSAKTLENLLVYAVKLTSLNIQIRDLTEPINNLLSLESLEKLTINSQGGLQSDYFDARNLGCLLANAKNLKKIKIGLNSKHISGNFEADLPLFSLEQLDLIGTVISAIKLEKLLANAKDLKVLKLYIISGKLSPGFINPAYLLEIDCSIMSTEDLIDLLQHSPNLITLKLSRCDYISAFNPELIRLIKERKIDLQYSELSEFKPPKDSQQAGQMSETSQSASKNVQPPPALPFQTPIRSNKDETCDADTTSDPDKQYNLKQIFLGKGKNPHPRDYRLEVHHRLEFNLNQNAVDDAFRLNNKALDLGLIEKKITRSENDLFDEFKASTDTNLFYGNLELLLDGEWQALPSLHCHETLQRYHLNKKVPCEINYSKRDNLYYIRSTDHQQHEVKFDFLLSAQPANKEDLSLANLATLIKFYKSFDEGAITRKSGQTFIDAINDNKKGACRHRAVALMDAINNKKKEHGLADTIECRCVANDCHMYVEIRLSENHPWIAKDLGGYPAKLTIDQSNLPARAEKTLPVDVPGFHIVSVTSDTICEKASIKSDSGYDVDYFLKKLDTWVEEKPETNQLRYFHHLTNGSKQKQLIHLSSRSHVNAMSLALVQHCQHKRPVFYIHSPDDLVCSSDFIKKTGKTGVLTQGPGGRLYDFLMANEKTNPVLIVNYDQFDADDIIRLNSLLNEEPKADGTPLPKGTIVVGLINPNKPGCYKGEDFYSRFGVGNVNTCPFTPEQLIKPLPKLPEPSQRDSVFKINLFHSINWEQRLLGHCLLKKDHLHFEKGLLKDALKSGKPIQIENGLWQNEAFCHFWNRARTLGYFEIEGEKFPVPKLLQSNHYDWQTLSQQMSWDNALQPEALVLNPSRFSDFFYQYECDNQRRQLDTLPGIIKQYQGKVLEVNLTQSLDEDQWAELLMECEKNKVKLHCHCAPSTTLPEAIGDVSSLASKPVPDSAIVIESTDIDVTLHQLTQKSTWTVIDVSELSAEHLLHNLDGKVSKKQATFKFTKTDSVLIQSLDDNENVILKGQFSPELIDMLAPTLLKKQAGELLLVTSDASQLKFVANKQHTVSLEEKYQCLEKDFPPESITKVISENPDEPLCRLKARLSQSNYPWAGLKGLSAGIKLKDFDEKNSEIIANDFIKERQVNVNEILDKLPYVFLTGLTGVGKSTFIEKHLINEGDTFYQGESSIREWAKDRTAGRKFLFLDEANISPSQWSQFEGLFQKEPYIIIYEKYTYKKVPLSPDHKVVFAGNPLNYGGNRKMASLFWRHGKACVFKAMPMEFIYERILKPVFASTELDSQALTISKEILKIYQFLSNLSQDEILISPRELQMMALMVLSHLQQHPKDNIIQVAQHYAYLLAQDLVPAKHRHAFESQFSDPLSKKPVKKKPENFVLTPSREPLYHHLNDLVALREFRRANPKLNDAQRYGGLGGIVIEGSPGIGKSELVIAQLRAHGYEEAHLHDKTVSDKAFYRMPISMSVEKKTELLVKAFHEGAVVIIDEINAAPMMEQLLNDLLMGKGPNGGYELQLMSKDAFDELSKDLKTKPYLLKTQDNRYLLWGYKKGNWKFTEMKNDFQIPVDWENKNTVFVSYQDESYKTLSKGHRPGYGRPNKPGFMVVGTQNPFSMLGRFQPSNALKRRITTVNLPDYPSEELETILSKQKIAQPYVKAMASAYQQNAEKAKNKKLSPAPTFRDLITTAKQFVNKVGPQKPKKILPILLNDDGEQKTINKGQKLKIVEQESSSNFIMEALFWGLILGIGMVALTTLVVAITLASGGISALVAIPILGSALLTSASSATIAFFAVGGAGFALGVIGRSVYELGISIKNAIFGKEEVAEKPEAKSPNLPVSETSQKAKAAKISDKKAGSWKTVQAQVPSLSRHSIFKQETEKKVEKSTREIKLNK